MAKKSKAGANARIAAEVGAGLAAAGAAAAAGYYFYGSDKAKQHRKKASKWAADLQKQVVKEAKKLEKVSAADVGRVVDTAALGYQKVRSIDPKDLRAAATELKKNWEMVRKEAMGGMARAKKVAKKARPAAKKAVKAAKKAVKKAAKKRR